MSFANRMFRMSRDFSANSGMKFASNSYGKLSFNFNTFKQQFRTFHRQAKRPHLKNTSRWNVYDELKLYSYTSHLAFFMLLPPILQMYTTKVEVTRDDTMTESSFNSVSSSNGMMIKNINFLDFLSSRGSDMMELYEKNLPKPAETVFAEDFVPQHFTSNVDLESDNRTRRAEPPQSQTKDEFDFYLQQLDAAFNSVKANSLSSVQYFDKIQTITDRLIGLTKNDNYKKDRANNTFMKIFDQLHQLRLHQYEMKLFRRLLTSDQHTEVKLVNIRQKIISNYEYAKYKQNHNNKVKSKAKNIPTHKLMLSSSWLKEYVNNFERFAQLLQLLATTKQNSKTFSQLYYVGLKSNDVFYKMQNTEIRYSLLSVLRGLGQTKEAYVLDKKIRKMMDTFTVGKNIRS
ncbi:uncharacterized protein C5L36_0C07390 [Pichia kudriavzevii]|uniref:Uncharacterized protein n=1 Tax=Pichia kudriavzevii TaxID=4909 RepID=A0A2U9R666_PICKU|nr:uncharacterized protein C5L36_0C07390 [Pichia kudriavzevii]AWU76823.1 hypothetical protein C5L36_0C07390 [Pichia kudriavzevii]